MSLYFNLFPDLLRFLDNSNTPVNVYASDNQLQLRMLLPGFSDKDISVTVEDDYLIIKAERKEAPPEGFSEVRTEFGPETVSRAFALRKRFDPSKIEAVTKDGILTITLPRADESKTKIQVKSSGQ